MRLRVGVVCLGGSGEVPERSRGLGLELLATLVVHISIRSKYPQLCCNLVVVFHLLNIASQTIRFCVDDGLRNFLCNNDAKKGTYFFS